MLIACARYFNKIYKCIFQSSSFDSCTNVICPVTAACFTLNIHQLWSQKIYHGNTGSFPQVIHRLNYLSFFILHGSLLSFFWLLLRFSALFTCASHFILQFTVFFFSLLPSIVMANSFMKGKICESSSSFSSIFGIFAFLSVCGTAEYQAVTF
jgi:hypothetical protein